MRQSRVRNVPTVSVSLWLLPSKGAKLCTAITVTLWCNSACFHGVTIPPQLDIECQCQWLTEICIVFPKRSRISDKDSFCQLLCAQVVIHPLKICTCSGSPSHSSSSLLLHVSACICVRASVHRKLSVRTRLDAKGSPRPDASLV